MHAAHFRIGWGIFVPGDSTCKLCFGATEDVKHFLLVCPSLSAVRLNLIARALDSILSLVPDLLTDPDAFFDSVLTGSTTVSHSYSSFAL